MRAGAVALLFCCAVTLLLPTRAAAAEPVPAIFAFSDASGSRLLALPSEDTPLPQPPQSLTRAMCSGGRVLPVEFEAMQSGDTEHHTSEYFYLNPGARYRITSRERLKPDTDCLLATEDFVSGRTLLSARAFAPAAGSLPRCSAAEGAQAAQRLGTPAASCRVLAEVGAARVLLAEVESPSDHRLAALLLTDAGRTVLLELPAQYGEWRASQEGFSERDFLLVFAAHGHAPGPQGNALELAIRWTGPEGGALWLLREHEDSLVKVVTAYRYWY